MKCGSFLAAAAAALILSGCCALQKDEALTPPVTISTVSGDFRLDGKLDEAVWQSAARYSFCQIETPQAPRVQERLAKDGFENGYVMFAKDDAYLYVAAKMDDADIVQYVNKNQIALWRYGDLLEVFIRTDNSSGYWELFASPRSNKTSIFFRSPGLKVFDSNFRKRPGMEVAAQLQGSLNKHDDVDQGWTVEMRIPIAELEEACGVKFSADQKWYILAARYNYAKKFRMEQYSAYPQLPQLQYHLLEYYAPLQF